MKTFAKIFALVSLYLSLAAWGVFLILPVNGDASVNISQDIYRALIDAALPKNIPQKNIPVLIVPHHLVADRQIRDGFAYVAAARKNNPPKRIILMGPNHYFRGNAGVITATHNWQTNYGEISADTSLIETMTKQNFAAAETGIPEGDHSITALLPFVERFFPNAVFTPLLVREPMSSENAKKLAQFFNENLGPETLMIVSTDFSHYLPKALADEHDRASLGALQSLDIDFFEKKMDVDARQILMVIAEYLKLKGSAMFTLLAHTNSADLTANPYETSTTSHFVGFYEL